MNDQAPTIPAKRQVISISGTGVMQCLRPKKGQGLDLRVFGNAEVKRVSEILFCDTAQKFYVQFLDGILAGRKLTFTLYCAATGKRVSFTAGQPVMLFDEYEDAVTAEVETLDAIRAFGHEWQPAVLNRISPISGQPLA